MQLKQATQFDDHDVLIDAYMATHSDAEPDWLAAIARETHVRTINPRMLSGHFAGRILKMLVRMARPQRVLEIGTFTGYSAICLASALGEDGHLDTLEVNDELEDLITEGFERASLTERITLHLGDCKETLRKFLQEGREYDLVYMDANKREYCEYYSLVFDLVRPGGLILADNVLWDGKVCQNPLPQDKQTISIARFNDLIKADPRVENVILPLRDGLSIIRRI